MVKIPSTWGAKISGKPFQVSHGFIGEAPDVSRTGSGQARLVNCGIESKWAIRRAMMSQQRDPANKGL